MGLPRSIIKKYGVSKKAWQVYRGQKTSPTKKKSKTTTRSVRTMARRKSRVRRYAKKAMSSDFTKMIAAGSYGAMRSYIATLISPVTNRIPLGGIADEVGLLMTAFLAKRAIRNSMVRNAANAALIVESASIGSALASGQLNMQSGTAASSGFPV